MLCEITFICNLQISSLAEKQFVYNHPVVTGAAACMCAPFTAQSNCKDHTDEKIRNTHKI